MSEKLYIRLSPYKYPAFWYGHFGMSVDRQDARFFVVLPAPEPAPHLIVLDNIDMMKSTFGYEPDIFLAPEKAQKLSTVKGRIDFAAVELACNLGEARRDGVPIIVLGVDADDEMFKGSYLRFLRTAAERLSDALGQSEHFSHFKAGLDEILGDNMFKSDSDTNDNSWADRLPYQDSVDSLVGTDWIGGK